MSSMIYTFKTFPAIKELPGNVFVFSKLKEDLLKFEQRLNTEKPDYILGIANTKGQSRIEPLAINRFNDGKVLADGPDSLELYVPQHYPAGFNIATKPTHSFCNWTMYKVQNLLLENKYPSRLMFVHININDVNKIGDILQALAPVAD